MWIEERSVKGKTRYCFIERYKSTLTGRYKRVSVTYGKKTPQVVKTATRELETKIQRALAKEGQGIQQITLQDLESRFLDEYKDRVRYKTFDNCKMFLGQFVAACGPDTLSQNITPVWINNYLSDQLYRKNRPLTNGTVRVKKIEITLLFEYAVNHGYLTNNPMEKVKIAWKNETANRRDKIENKYLTIDEYHAIVNDFTSRNMQHYADAFKLLFLTGMRFGELAALQVKDIIKEDGKTYLDINSTMVWKKNPYRHVISQTTKSFAGMRKIVLSSEAIEIVNRRIQGKDPDALLFAINTEATSYDEQRPFSVSNTNIQLKRCARRQGIDKMVSTHYFRHTHVSVLADMGVPLRVIQKRVGHSNGNITSQIYMHVTKDAQKAFEARVNELDRF